MAKITYEAGDVVSFFNDNELEWCLNEWFFGVCLDAEECIIFPNIASHSGKVVKIPQSALPVDLYRSVPDSWQQMFESMVEVAKWRAGQIA